MKRILALLLACLVLAGCASAPQTTQQAETTTEVVSTEPDPILMERRDAAEAYMREMATVLWRATEDLTWTTDSTLVTEDDLAAYCEEKKPMVIRAGRLYQGVPYSYSGAPAGNFYAFFNGEDERVILPQPVSIGVILTVLPPRLGPVWAMTAPALCSWHGNPSAATLPV